MEAIGIYNASGRRDYRRTAGVRNLHRQGAESGLFRKDVPNERNFKRMDV